MIGESTYIVGFESPRRVSPQWSPPLNGGSIMLTQGACLNYLLPQWSRHRTVGTWPYIKPGLMNRGPQWSPPLTRREHVLLVVGADRRRHAADLKTRTEI